MLTAIVWRAIKLFIALGPTAFSAVLSPSARAQSAWSDDARMQKLVSVDAEGVGLPELLALLSAKTEVSLSTRSDASIDKIVVFSHRRPLGELLSDLAALFDYSWETSRTSSGELARYELYSGLKARTREAALVQLALGAVGSRLQEFVNGLSLSEEALSRLPQDDPFRRSLSDPNCRTGFQFYSLLSHDQKNQLLSNRKISIPYNALSRQQQAAADTLMSSLIARLQEHARQHRNNPGVDIQIPSQDQLRNTGIGFRLRKMAGRHQLVFKVGQTGIAVGTVDSRSTWILPAHGDPYDPQHALAGGPLPASSVSRGAQSEGSAIADRLRKLSAETKAPVLADYYRSGSVSSAMIESAGAGNSPISSLDNLCASPGYLWWKRGNTLLFRKRDYYLQRQYEAPEEFYKALADRFKKGDPDPSVADLMRMDNLTLHQIAGIASLITPLADESTLSGFPELLRLASLSPVNRSNDVFQPGGIRITYRDLPVRARRLLAAFAGVNDIPITKQATDPLVVRVGRAFRASGRQTDPPFSEVQFRWTMPSGNGSYFVYLPHGFPDDRRVRTRVTAI